MAALLLFGSGAEEGKGSFYWQERGRAKSKNGPQNWANKWRKLMGVGPQSPFFLPTHQARDTLLYSRPFKPTACLVQLHPWYSASACPRSSLWEDLSRQLSVAASRPTSTDLARHASNLRCVRRQRFVRFARGCVESRVSGPPTVGARQ